MDEGVAPGDDGLDAGALEGQHGLLAGAARAPAFAGHDDAGAGRGVGHEFGADEVEGLGAQLGKRGEVAELPGDDGVGVDVVAEPLDARADHSGALLHCYAMANRILGEGLQQQMRHARLEHIARRIDLEAQEVAKTDALDLEIGSEEVQLILQARLLVRRRS